MVALAPGMILASTVNWDLWAVGDNIARATRMGAEVSGARRGADRLAAAFKFYPVLILGPLLILCLRAGRMRAVAADFRWCAHHVAGSECADHGRPV